MFDAFVDSVGYGAAWDAGVFCDGSVRFALEIVGDEGGLNFRGKGCDSFIDQGVDLVPWGFCCGGLGGGIARFPFASTTLFFDFVLGSPWVCPVVSDSTSADPWMNLKINDFKEQV